MSKDTDVFCSGFDTSLCMSDYNNILDQNISVSRHVVQFRFNSILSKVHHFVQKNVRILPCNFLAQLKLSDVFLKDKQG